MFVKVFKCLIFTQVTLGQFLTHDSNSKNVHNIGPPHKRCARQANLPDGLAATENFANNGMAIGNSACFDNGLQKNVFQNMNNMPFNIPAQNLNNLQLNIPTQNWNNLPPNIPAQNWNNLQLNIPTQNWNNLPLNIPTQNLNSVPVNLPTQIMNNVPVNLPTQNLNNVINNRYMPSNNGISNNGMAMNMPVNNGLQNINGMPNSNNYILPFGNGGLNSNTSPFATVNNVPINNVIPNYNGPFNNGIQNLNNVPSGNLLSNNLPAVNILPNYNNMPVTNALPNMNNYLSTNQAALNFPGSYNLPINNRANSNSFQVNNILPNGNFVSSNGVPASPQNIVPIANGFPNSFNFPVANDFLNNNYLPNTIGGPSVNNFEMPSRIANNNIQLNNGLPTANMQYNGVDVSNINTPFTISSNMPLHTIVPSGNNMPGNSISNSISYLNTAANQGRLLNEGLIAGNGMAMNNLPSNWQNGFQGGLPILTNFQLQGSNGLANNFNLPNGLPIMNGLPVAGITETVTLLNGPCS